MYFFVVVQIFGHIISFSNKNSQNELINILKKQKNDHSSTRSHNVLEYYHYMSRYGIYLENQLNTSFKKLNI